MTIICWPDIPDLRIGTMQINNITACRHKFCCFCMVVIATISPTILLSSYEQELQFKALGSNRDSYPHPLLCWQVSDLDGTMVGNGHEADAMTRSFTQYWEDNAVLRNSVLVYNTGRSLGQFTSLYQEKAGALALPNVLITAVGTKVGCRVKSSASLLGIILAWAHN